MPCVVLHYHVNFKVIRNGNVQWRQCGIFKAEVPENDIIKYIKNQMADLKRNIAMAEADCGFLKWRNAEDIKRCHKDSLKSFYDC